MKCVHCGKELKTFDVIDENDNPVCNKCFHDYYDYCNNCRRAIPKGEGLCKSCADVVFRKVINPYSTKVTNIFGNKNDNVKCLNSRYYGMEMEYNNFSPSVARVLFKEQYNNKLIYNKSDSSISGGVEIVTIPLIKSRLLKLIDDMDLDSIKHNSTGRSVEEGAGLHIHVSRNTITPIAIHRLSILFNSGWSNPYKEYIYYICGRSNNLDLPTSDSFFRVGSTSLLRSVQDDYVSSHGVALNLGNTKTVEFRLFKSTTNKEQLKSYLQFVELAIQFAETQPIKMMTIPNFITYLYLNATNEWLIDRIKYVKDSNPDLLTVKEKKFTFDYYLDKIDGKDIFDKYEKIDRINKHVYSSFINWDCDKIDNRIISEWERKSNGYSPIDKKLLNALLDEIKNRVIKNILVK